jgi:beta-glucosidase
MLPLDKGSRIVVAGPAAHDRGRQCGGFTVEWQGVSGNGAIEGGTSIWEGIRGMAPRAVLWGEGDLSAARDFDVGVVIVGERPYAEGLGDIREPSPVRPGAHLSAAPETLEPYGDTLEFAALHPEALRTIFELADRGIPVVTVLIAGRPLVVNDELAASSAFVAAWLPGSEGAGVADVLFGNYPFMGRLPMSWPREMPAGNGRGGRRDIGALFPRGYGLRPR